MKKILVPLALVALPCAVIYSYMTLSDDSVDTSVQREGQIKSATAENRNQALDSDMCQDFHQIAAAMGKEPQETLFKISQLQSNQDKQNCYQAAFLAWSDADYLALLDWLPSFVPDALFDPAMSSLADKYVSNAADAVRFVEKVYVLEQKQKLLEKFLPIWAQQDAESALVWSVSYQPVEHSIAWIELVVDAIASRDVSLAISALTALGDGSLEQLRAANQIVINYFDPDLVNASMLAAIESLAPERVKAELLFALLPLMFASENVSLADLEYMIASLSPGEVKDELVKNLASNWVFSNPEEAAAYADSLEGDTRDIAITAVVSSWIHEDLYAADEWLQSVDGNIDMAAEAFGKGASTIGHIEMSDRWIDSIEDSELRRNTAVAIMNQRYKEEPASGIYDLVFQKHISEQQKLAILHDLYPEEVFISPTQALAQLGRLEGLESPFSNNSSSLSNED